MEFEPDYSVDEPEAPGGQQEADREPSAEAEEPQVTEDGTAGGVEAAAAQQSRLRAGCSGATPPPGDAVPEEWQVCLGCCRLMPSGLVSACDVKVALDVHQPQEGCCLASTGQ